MVEEVTVSQILDLVDEVRLKVRTMPAKFRKEVYPDLHEVVAGLPSGQDEETELALSVGMGKIQHTALMQQLLLDQLHARVQAWLEAIDKYSTQD